ncbi:MAG: hypothetical protein A2664_00510 [Candidatus Taylorbacteria bacterium RIFCSPHIGHO2_01_FULL_46_22b]|uniref:Uncharacterized protein n=1 Tax=Candidatus Taylorbacteria bacterium RIFCSPHIGHO2_01_FULL_46_22b TaxID=1802301 RepID=A0A1G2M5S6_9BACT|nr:MAG: hypothetical protein A2664_00510 [Candidatus Taylorbacteria bacterium RIFCSPHIGHO2_01_FULL_46_22b]
MPNEGRGSGKREFPRGGEQQASEDERSTQRQQAAGTSVENREVLKIKLARLIPTILLRGYGRASFIPNNI